MNSKTEKVRIVGDGEHFAEMLVNSSTPHRLIYTNNSISIETEGGNTMIFSDQELTPFELSFIGMTKAEVSRAAEGMRLKMCSPKFFHIYDTRPGFYDSCEVDINSAYWECAYRLGLLSKRIYETGNSVSKTARLIAFGAAATIRREFVFDGHIYVSCSEASNKWGRAAYFKVAQIVTNTLRDICSEIPGEALAYWVDAIFVSDRYANYVQKRLFDEGYFFKVKKLSECEFFIDQSDPAAPGRRTLRMIEKETGREKFLRLGKPKKAFLSGLVHENMV